jgi:DNA-binding NtrC family response regulator
MEAAMNSIYHNLRKIKSDVAARLLIREVLAKNNGNVTKTASILGISRHTVRRARDGRLEDCSRAPKRVNRKYSWTCYNKVDKELRKY